MDAINRLTVKDAQEQFLKCCGSPAFAAKLASQRPFSQYEQMVEIARQVWFNEVSTMEWLKAFEAHPRIGDVEGLRKKFASTASWCEGEQGTAMSSADEAVIQALAQGNKDYEAKFGHIFIICATGKPAAVILEALKSRYPNNPHHEMMLAAQEQQKITEIRLTKLLEDFQKGPVTSPAVERRTNQLAAHVVPSIAPTGAPKRSPITTHVLDITCGRPAQGIHTTLEKITGPSNTFSKVGEGVTNGDGRIGDLLVPGSPLQPGTYRITFQLTEYLKQNGGGGFYPYVPIIFEVLPSQVKEHFHVPLLLSPYGYSTYRGS
mmetsp:Transcript_23781/g.28707  ORF Transcript_23781/g.28707 Transcript_23781/m.28707 type:complete len:319 (+) Transcript_23781:44-1000(+)|eukprot:CAMPEP_0197860636 /NCGR_PEP_ID=MMETSP1438-20131217/36142_1 /TAXON_ID=1461541 /ORGANISM="Pterosperma sp., Strain CCMP1384" /LENGTH=318 /DNA_ID=CAMNT_0043477579 /DNA_START=41 /DNA_END=997 /DNA_ORIENTATION=+